MNTAELQARQAAALAKNNARKRLVVELTESNARLNDQVTALQQAGTDVAALQEELTNSNLLLDQLQSAVLSDDVDAPAPTPEPAPADGPAGDPVLVSAPGPDPGPSGFVGEPGPAGEPSSPDPAE